jgi:thiamine biosynthesis lipoprotein
MRPRAFAGWKACITSVAFGSTLLAGDTRHDFSQPAMGTTFRIACYAADKAIAAEAASAAFARIDALNAALSDYTETSELRRLCQTSGTPVRVSEDLFTVIRRAHEVAESTDGAFDFTAGHLTNLWRRTRRQRDLPSEERLRHALTLTGWRQVALDEKNRAITLMKPGMYLDLGGIAKGYAAEAALAVMRARRLPRSVVIAGGDMAIGEAPPGEAGWEVKLRTFSEEEADADAIITLRLKNAGISTSGDLYQFVEIGGLRYSHIIDPKSGLGLTKRVSCSVISKNTTTSDAYATAFCVMGTSATLDYCQRHPGMEVRLVNLISGQKPQVTTTPGFPKTE